MPRALAAVIAGVLLVSSRTEAQRESVPTSPPEHLVRIDAVISDARGRSVDDLKTADFELREDGALRPVEAARFVARAPRVFAIFIDEYHIGAGASAARARDALTRFIDREITPDDQLVVMKPLDSLLGIRFTHDLEGARRIVAGLDGRKGDYTPRNDYERSNWAGDPTRVEAARTQVGLSAINALAVEMGALAEARKTMIVVTEALGRPVRRRGQEYLTTLDAAIRSAGRANAAVYVVDPHETPAGGGGEESVNEPIQALTRGTDGQLIADADLEVGMKRIVRDASAYYVITYRAVHKEDGAFHPVEIRVKRPGVQLHARPGYWAPSPDDVIRAAVVKRASEPLPPIRYEPARHVSPLIQPWFGLSRAADGKTRVTFVWEPATRVPGDRVRHYPTRVDVTALSSDDTVLFKGQVTPLGSGSADAQSGPAARAVFDAAPGSVRVRMTIEDEAFQPLDNDVRDLTIRDWRAPVTVGTPAVLRARNAREFRTLVGDAEALPVAAREFSRAERLLIRFPAYAPAGDRPAISARLLGRSGLPMRDMPVEAAAAPDGTNQVDLPLAGLAPSDYILELVAKSPAGEGRERLAFRVTN